MHRCEEIDRHEPDDLVGRRAGRILADAEAGVVDENVDPAEPLLGLLHHGLTLLRYGEVPAIGDAGGGMTLAFGHDLGEPVGAPGGGDDGDAAAGQVSGHSRANA